MAIDIKTLGLDKLEEQYGLPSGWLENQAKVESNFNPDAVSSAGAKGLFQLMDGTAQDLGVDPLDPQQAAEGAARYNAQLFKKYDGDPAKVAAAYNWGMGNVDRHGLENAPTETKNYIQKFADFINPIGTANAAEANPFDAFDEKPQSAANPFDAFDEKTPTAPDGVQDAGTVYPQDGVMRPAKAQDEDNRPVLGRKLSPIETLIAGLGNIDGDTGLLPIADEAAGVGAGIGNLLSNKGTFSEGYKRGQDRQNALERQFEVEHPNVARATTALPYLAALPLAGEKLLANAAAPESTSAVARLAAANPKVSAALLSSGTGAAQGYLSATGDRRMPSAIAGGVGGLVLGPIAGRVAGKLGAIADNAGSKLAAVLDNTPIPAAARTMADKVAAMGMRRDATAAAERVEPSLLNEAPLNVPPVSQRSATFAEQYGNQPIMDYQNGGTLHNSDVRTPAQSVEVRPQASSAAETAPPIDKNLPLSEQLRQQGQALYRKAADAGGVLDSKIIDKWLDTAASIKPKTAAGRLVAGSDGPADALLERIQGLRGQKLDLESAQDIDEQIGALLRKDSFTDRFGKLNDDGRKVYELQTSLRSIIEQARPEDVSGGKAGFDALKDARQLWSHQARAREIESIINRAEGRDNPDTIIKNGFQTLKNNQKRLKGYTMEERKLIGSAAKTGFVEEGLRLLGSRLNAIGALAGGGPAASAAMFGVGMASRKGAKSLAERRGLRVLDEIATPSRRRLKAPLNIAASVTGGAVSGKLTTRQQKR